MTEQITSWVFDFVGVLGGAVAAIIGSYFSNNQQYKNKIKSFAIKKLKEAFSIVELLLDDATILVERDRTIKNNRCGDDVRDEDAEMHADNINTLVMAIDKRRRKPSVYFEANDLRLSGELKLLCDLYGNEETAELATKVYGVINRMDGDYAFASIIHEPQIDDIENNQMDKLVATLIDLKKKLKLLINAI